MKVVTQLVTFLLENKRFWLLPIVAALLLVGALIMLSHASPLSPFIYPLM